MTGQQFHASFINAKVELQEAYKGGPGPSDIEVYFFLQMKFMNTINKGIFSLGEMLDYLKGSLNQDQRERFAALHKQLHENFEELKKLNKKPE